MQSEIAHMICGFKLRRGKHTDTDKAWKDALETADRIISLRAPSREPEGGAVDWDANDQELIERGLRTIRTHDAVRYLREALTATTVRLTGYDWNADPDGVTKQQGDAFAAADRVFADLDAAVASHPEIELPECQTCGGTGKIEEAARMEGANKHSACIRTCDDCDGCGFAPDDEPAAIATREEAPAEDDDGPCTCCDDTGITIQTERPCACAAGIPFEAPADDGPVFHMNLLSHEDNEAWLESARRVAAKHEAPAEGTGEAAPCPHCGGPAKVMTCMGEWVGKGKGERGGAYGPERWTVVCNSLYEEPTRDCSSRNISETRDQAIAKWNGRPLRARSSAPEAREGEVCPNGHQPGCDCDVAEEDVARSKPSPAAPSADKLREDK